MAIITNTISFNHNMEKFVPGHPDRSVEQLNSHTYNPVAVAGWSNTNWGHVRISDTEKSIVNNQEISENNILSQKNQGQDWQEDIDNT